jgi:hypothetical protein
MSSLLQDEAITMPEVPARLAPPRSNQSVLHLATYGHLLHRCLHNSGSPIPTPRPSFMASSYSSCIAHCSKSFSKMSKTCDPQHHGDALLDPLLGLYKTWTHTFCTKQAFTYQGPWLLKSPKYAEKCCESRGSSFRLDEEQTDLKPPTGCCRVADNVCLDSRFRRYTTVVCITHLHRKVLKNI